MKLITCLVDNLALLPHFCRHYRRLGVTEFHFGVYDRDRLQPEIVKACDGFNWFVYNMDWPSRDSFGEWIDTYWQTDWKRRHVAPGEWCVVADLDEFVRVDGDLTALLAAATNDCLGGLLVDRVAADGTLAEIQATPELEAQFPIACDLTRQINPEANITKLCFFRGPDIPIKLGHHAWEHVQSLHPAVSVDHYKWTSGLRERQMRRSQRPRHKEFAERTLRYFANFFG